MKDRPTTRIMNLPGLFRRLLRLPESDYYECPHCGYRWPKKDVKISGWPGSSSCPPHVHCPNCGKIVTRAP